MANWQWQQPGQEVAPRPRCWGMPEAYDLSSRECRGCSSQNSCGDTVQRSRNARAFQARQAPPGPAYPQAAPQQAYYGPTYRAPAVAQSFQPQAVPLPVQQPPVQQYVPQPQQQIIQHPQTQQPVRVYDPPPAYHYGWLNDPLYYSGVATPPPMRPQLAGETFFERVVKNMGLSMMESMFLQGFLAVRQMVLAPGAPETQVPGDTENR